MDRFPRLDRVAGLEHAITTRSPSEQGDSEQPEARGFNLGHGCGDDVRKVQRHRAALASQLGFPGLLIPQQVHGDHIQAVERWPPNADGAAFRCDALVTNRTGALLGVLGADCPAVLIVAPIQHALAVVHAGWRGVAARIVPKTLECLQQRYGVDIPGLQVGIGPGISSSRYEVTTEVAVQIAAAVAPKDASTVVTNGRPGHAHVDLIAAIQSQLLAVGVPMANIERHGACTYEDERRFFSHRREAGKSGRHALVAGWLDQGRTSLR